MNYDDQFTVVIPPYSDCDKNQSASYNVDVGLADFVK